jgi:ATP-dependent helicase/nuclease subunit B
MLDESTAVWPDTGRSARNMGIRYIIGRAGSGKSTACLEEIRSRLLKEADGHPLLLLVPEQATFQAELALVTTPGIHGLLRAQVMSFRRLAWRVMQETGGIAGTPIDDLGKKMLLHRLLHKNNSKLRLFRQAYEKTGFVDNLHNLFGELKRYNVPSGELERHSGRLNGKLPESAAALGDKLHDLLLVYREYEAELNGDFLDGDSFLTKLAERAGECSWLRDAEIWIDGFNGFTPQEQTVVEALAEHSRQTTLTLTLNRPYAAGEYPHELDLFHPTATTMRKLQEALGGKRLPETQVEVLKETVPPRFAGSPMLAHLERQYEYRLSFARRLYEPGSGEKPQVAIRAAVHRRAEVEASAREILRLVRDRGLRWRDVALRVRNIEDYGELLSNVFNDYGIPYFMDQKRPVLNHPLVELIRSALEAVNRNWPYEAVFRCVKTGFFLPMENDSGDDAPGQEDWDSFENYVLMYGIHGRRFLDPRSWQLKRQPSLEDEDVPEERASGEDELSAGETPVQSAEPSGGIIAACAARVTEPLKRLQKRLAEAAGAEHMAEAVFLLLEELRVPERLEAWAGECIAEGRPEKAKEHSQLWDLIIDVLDQLAGLMAGDEVKPELFAKLVDTGLEGLRLGLVPPAMDQVLIGSIDRTRAAHVKVAFVLGASEGVLPKKMQDDGIIAENEREFMLEQGVPMANSSRRRLLDEQFLIYTVLCTPSERLYISYPLADEEGRTLLPSEVIKQVKSLLPTVKEGLDEPAPSLDMPVQDQLEFIAGPGKAISDLIVQMKGVSKGTALSPVWVEVYNWLIDRQEWRERLWAPSRSLFYQNGEEALSDATSLFLYGEHLRASVSRMERFAACPFSHFASYGLKLRERRIYRLEAPDIGQLYHAALSGLAKQIGLEQLDWGLLSEEEILLRVSRIVDFLSPRLQNEILSSTSRYRYMAQKLKGILGKTSVMLAEHARRGAFVPVGLEVGFGPGEELPSLILPLANGRVMELIGRIDRVDRAYSGQGMLLRIIDYKSGPTALRLPEVYHGLTLQMLTYLDVVLTHSAEWLGESAKPAGVLYFHVHNPLLPFRNNPNPAEAEAAVRKQFKTRGLITADADAVFLMDSALKEKGGHSDLIPVSMKNDGSFYKSASVASDEGWNRLRTHVRSAIRQIGTGITGGRVEAEPYRLGKKTACAFCPYKPVCRFDPQMEGNKERAMRVYGKDDVWLALEETALCGPDEDTGAGRRGMK